MPKKNTKNKKAATKKAVKKVEKKKVAVKKPSTKKPVAKKAVVKKIIKKVAPKNIKKTPIKEVKKPEPKIEKKLPEVFKEIPKKPSEIIGKQQFKISEHIVYPSHGVGKVAGIEKIKILDKEISFYELFFEKEKLTIKVPSETIHKSGVRKLATKAQLEEVLSILRNGVKKTKGMWSRRAQEYETKINSGDIILLAEVLRDLTRDVEDSERSYSERMIYETAIDRLANEYAIVHAADFEQTKEKIVTIARDKLASEGKVVAKKDDFDDFDAEEKDPDEIDEEDEESEEEEDDFDIDYDDEDDKGKPKKKSKK